ncbi:ras guanine nucleotide exchange factor domain-containing protein [Phlyctochytrium arcticum]|nr:ras guanine nucleotide exchange factor domain-containing protein [Phlyctochytrium arcticum]
MRLKLHGSFEALRDHVQSGRKSKTGENNGPGSGGKSGSVDQLNQTGGPHHRGPALSGLTRVSSASSFDLAKSRGSRMSLLDGVPLGHGEGAAGSGPHLSEGELSDSISELHTRPSPSVTSRGSQGRNSRLSKEMTVGTPDSGSLLVGSGSGSRPTSLNRGQKGDPSRNSVFFKPGFFNTDQALQPNIAAASVAFAPAPAPITTIQASTPAYTVSTDDDDTQDDVIPQYRDSVVSDGSGGTGARPSQSKYREMAGTFAVSSILDTGGDDDNDPIGGTLSRNYNTLPHQVAEESVDQTSASSPRNRLSRNQSPVRDQKPEQTPTTTVQQSIPSSSESLSVATRPSFASTNSLADNTLIRSASYGSRSRLDSASSQSKMGRKLVERTYLGPFVASTRRKAMYQKLMDSELFALLDIYEWGSQELDPEGPFVALPLPPQGQSIATEVCDGKTKVLSANLPDLVRLLASEGATDAEYVSDFLYTYRYFSDPKDVARLLILRYVEIITAENEFGDEPPTPKSPDKSASPGEARPDWAAFLQLRVLNVFKKWIDGHAADFEDCQQLYQLVEVFLRNQVRLDPKRAPFADSMLKNLEEKVENVRKMQSVHALKNEAAVLSETERRSSLNNTTPDPRYRRPSLPTTGTPSFLSRTLSPLNLDVGTAGRSSMRGSSQPPTPLTAGAADRLANLFHPRSNSAPPVTSNPSEPDLPEGPTLSDFDPEMIAQQLTLLEHTQFKLIRPFEFFFQAWNDRHLKDVTSPNLSSLITWFNRVAYGVATEVVLGHKLKNRVTSLKRFIYIAQMSFRWNNFNTLFEIVAGLNLGPVTRLKKTWKSLPKKYWDVWNQLNQIVSNEGSYRTYRNAIRSTVQKSGNCPILPYLGVNLSDLTFAEDGNPTFITQPAGNSTASAGNHGPASPLNSQSTQSTVVAQSNEPIQQTTAPLPPAGSLLSLASSSNVHTFPLINFTKFRLISALVQSVSHLQRGDFPYTPDEKIRNFLRNEWIVLDDAELYEASRAAEPKLPAA